MVEGEPPRRENPLTQGMRYGGVGCMGCLTFVVLGLFASAVAAKSPGLAAVLLLATLVGAVITLVRRRRR